MGCEGQFKGDHTCWEKAVRETVAYSAAGSEQMRAVWEVPRVAEHGPWGHGAVGRWEALGG